MRAGLISFLLFAALLIAWQLLAASPTFKFLLGDPFSIGSILFAQTIDGTLPSHALVTGTEAAVGFVIGVVSGTIVGFSLWRVPAIAGVMRPYIFILGIVPIFAFAPVVIVWFGIGFWMKVGVVALGTFLTALSQAYEGAKQVDEEQLRLLRILRASRKQMLWTVIIPSSLSWVYNSMKLNISVALFGAFIGEFISADRGIGFYMLRAGSLYDTPSVFAGGVYLILLGLIFHAFLLMLERMRPWIIGVVAVDRSVRTISRARRTYSAN